MMKRVCAAFLVLVAVALYGRPGGSIELSEQKGVLGYIVFMHTGPKSPDDTSVRAIAGQLVRSGYVVRAPEGDQDKVGGPGVDYFADDAKPAAERLADTVNKLLEAETGFKPLKPRRQNLKNPPNYLGLWLF
jgi:hypothetical protein